MQQAMMTQTCLHATHVASPKPHPPPLVEMDEMDEEESGGKERDEADECVDRKTSAVYLHLLSRPDCLGVYDDSHFSFLSRARYVQQLKVLEAVCIRIHKPVLCKQKEHVVALKLYS